MWFPVSNTYKRLIIRPQTQHFQTITPSPEYAGRCHMAWIYAAVARKHALQMFTVQSVLHMQCGAQAVSQSDSSSWSLFLRWTLETRDSSDMAHSLLLRFPPVLFTAAAPGILTCCHKCRTSVLMRTNLMLWHSKVWNTGQRPARMQGTLFYSWWTVVKLYCVPACVCEGEGEHLEQVKPVCEKHTILRSFWNRAYLSSGGWMMQYYYTTPLLWACAEIFDICTAICWFFKNTESVLCLSCSAPCCPALFFPAGTFLTLTSRVYQPLRSTKDPEANSLFSQVLEKTNHTLWEPFFPPYRSPNQRRGCPDGQQLSLCRHNYRPGSGYWHGRAGAGPPPRSSAVSNVRTACSTI